MPANLENSAVATGLEKINFHSNPKERHAKDCANYHTIALISHASKIMLKILQARLQQYVDETQAGIKIARRNINNLRYVDDTILMAESKEELKSLLMKVKEESERVQELA